VPVRSGGAIWLRIPRPALHLTQSEVRRNKVALRMELGADLPPVTGDRVQLQQVVVNLILNAIEAMSTAEGRERDLLISTRLVH